MPEASFPDLPTLAQHLRNELEYKKKFVLLYAYNGTGKTRLSTAFKNLGKTVDADGEVTGRDTLYFNAFTEDLFSWDNDLKNDRERVLRINRESRFLDGLRELEMDNRIRPLLSRYADFDFRIDPDEWEVSFTREVRERQADGTYATRREEDIKVSRGEENIFIWCFFLAVVRLVLDGDEAYRWVRYIYIDDPISSLDENNAVMVANHLAKMLGEASRDVGTVVSSHHVLFFNVLCNELRKSHKYFLRRTADPAGFAVYDTTSKPFLSHLAALVELHEAERSGQLYTHHFNAMRRVMEQTAGFLGYQRWDECIRPDSSDPNPTIYKRVIDLMSHGDYSLYEPREMMPENKEHFGRVLRQFIATHPFSPALFPGTTN